MFGIRMEIDMGEEFSHFDGNGNAIMVDVSAKNSTQRVAVARGTIYVNDAVMTAILNKEVKKGDVLGVARVAGIMAVKRTHELIPMCHPLMIQKCSVDFEINEKDNFITAICRVKVEGKTGVEIEALHGVQVSLLTIYDMCKAIDKSMEMKEIYLEEKTGGKSGTFTNPKHEIKESGI